MHSPRGLVRIFRFFHQKSRHDINKLKFSRNTKFSNLSSEEWSALKSPKKRQNIVIKATDKGGAVVVRRADLRCKFNYFRGWGIIDINLRSNQVCFYAFNVVGIRVN